MENVIANIVKKVAGLDEKREKLVEIVYEILKANNDDKLKLRSCTLTNIEGTTNCGGSYSVLTCSALELNIDLSMCLGTGDNAIHGDNNHRWYHPTRTNVEYFLRLTDEILEKAKSLGE
jgi:hypothetical protein